MVADLKEVISGVDTAKLRNSILNPCLSTDLWCLQRVKNKITLGTLEEAAFQLSLRWRDKPEDPLAVPLFSDALPYHCLPHW